MPIFDYYNITFENFRKVQKKTNGCCIGYRVVHTIIILLCTRTRTYNKAVARRARGGGGHHSERSDAGAVGSQSVVVGAVDN